MIVSPLNGVLPIVPLNVVSPAVLVARLWAPDTVELKLRLPLEVLVNVVLAPRVTAPV